MDYWSVKFTDYRETWTKEIGLFLILIIINCLFNILYVIILKIVGFFSFKFLCNRKFLLIYNMYFECWYFDFLRILIFGNFIACSNHMILFRFLVFIFPTRQAHTVLRCIHVFHLYFPNDYYIIFFLNIHKIYFEFFIFLT